MGQSETNMRVEWLTTNYPDTNPFDSSHWGFKMIPDFEGLFITSPEHATHVLIENSGLFLLSAC